MPDRVVTIGAHRSDGVIRGQGCLACPDPNLQDPENRAIAKAWIFQNATPPAVGPDSKYPLSLELDEMMELYWRAKKMEIDYSFTGTDGFGDSVSGSDRIVFKRSRNVTREADLILPSSWEYSSRDSPNGPATADIFFADANNDAVKVNGSEYFPYLYLSISTGDFTFPFIRTEKGGFVYTESGDLKGNTFEVYVTGTGTGSEALSTFYLTIDITEYWPHEKEDGTAKYNTTTGAKL